MMKMMKNILSALALLAVLSSCSLKWRMDGQDQTQQIAVEGWIEEGGFANVILTQSIRLDPNTDETEIALGDIPIRWGKVTVSDGEQEEVLVGRMSDGIYPPFIYTGSRIRGEAGKKYTLKAEYSGRTLTAETRIPAPAKIDDVEVIQSELSDTLYSIRISLSDDPSEKNWYKVFTMIRSEEHRYYSSFLGTVSDEVFSGDSHAELTVNRAFRHTRLDSYTPFFAKGDTVYVKLSQLPEDGFRFWSDYENEISNGKNILFPSTSNLSSNISGGRGIWCGYGSDIKEVIIK